MYKGIYKIADKSIAIHSIHKYIHEYCKEYIYDGEPEFIIETTEQDITFERLKSASEDAKEGIPTRKFSDSYLETLAVYRKLVEALADSDILLYHGSVVAVDNEAYLFTATSGTGKSTHTKLWLEYFGERASIVNDDKPLIKVSNDEITVYGTPWDGKHRRSSNISVPLKAICILERSEKNNIKKVTPQEVYPLLLQQMHRPTDTAKLSHILNIVDRMTEKTALYRLGCNISTDAVETAYNAMKG